MQTKFNLGNPQHGHGLNEASFESRRRCFGFLGVGFKHDSKPHFLIKKLY